MRKFGDNMEDLVLVKTNVKPYFMFALYPSELIEQNSKRFEGFLDKIARRYLQ